MANKLRDISGQRFGRLLVVLHVSTNREAAWQCRCDCGKVTVVRGTRLRSGQVVDCGCGVVARRRAGSGTRTHGMEGTETYNVWKGMKARCLSPSNKDYRNYGGRGIRVCSSWMSFEAFVADMGVRPAGMTIERINTNGHYEPGNCKWATMKAQQRNRRNNRLVEYQGRVMPLAQACEEAQAGVDWHKARNRMRAGWSVHRAVETA